MRRSPKPIAVVEKPAQAIGHRYCEVRYPESPAAGRALALATEHRLHFDPCLFNRIELAIGTILAPASAAAGI